MGSFIGTTLAGSLFLALLDRSIPEIKSAGICLVMNPSPQPISNIHKDDFSVLKLSETTNEWIKENYAVNEANLKCKNQKVAKLLNSKLGCEIIKIVYIKKTSHYEIGEYTKDLEELEVMIKENKIKEEAQKKLDEIKWAEDQEEYMNNKQPNPLDYGVNMDD